MINNLEEALGLLENLPKYEVKPGLERIKFLLDSLDNPNEAFHSIHIAGSNGKGSVLALLSGVLSQEYRVGEFISPPLINFSGRIKVDGEEIGNSQILEGVKVLEGQIEELKRRGDPPSLFEAATALATWYFDKEGVDLGLLEVGLGGRYDATNPVGQTLVSTVTSVDLEHQNVLGGTLEEIAGELAGIAKEGRPLIVGPSENVPKDVFNSECRKKDCTLVYAREETELELLDFDWDTSRFKVKRSPITSLRDEIVQIGLPGTYQKRNLTTALTVMGAIGETKFSVNPKEIIEGLKEVKWPGRFQLLGKNPHLLVDGAHNESATAALAKEIESYGSLRPKTHKTVLVFSALKDKNVRGMLSVLDSVVDKIFLTELDHPRATPLKALKNWSDQLDLNYREFPSPAEAVNIAKEEAREKDLICVTGSLYLVREVIVNESRR
ncbi:MAG: cyanophycin synthetase [Candidatus Bipolaricaulota bacterium]